MLPIMGPRKRPRSSPIYIVLLATLRFNGVSDCMHMEKRAGWDEPNPIAANAAPTSIVPIDLLSPTIKNETANNASAGDKILDSPNLSINHPLTGLEIIRTSANNV